jgi:hypothetical protein
MKNLIRVVVLVLSLSGVPALQSAEKKEAPTTASEPSVAGQYVGTWNGSGDRSGKLRLKLKQDGATWTAEASFTFDNAEVPAVMKQVEVDGSKVQVVFDWDIRGSLGQSKLTGELKGDTLGGTFDSKSRDGSSDTSQGTWKVTRS